MAILFKIVNDGGLCFFYDLPKTRPNHFHSVRSLVGSRVAQVALHSNNGAFILSEKQHDHLRGVIMSLQDLHAFFVAFFFEDTVCLCSAATPSIGCA